MAIEYLRRPEPNSPTRRPKSAAWIDQICEQVVDGSPRSRGIKAVALGGVGRRAKILYRE